MRVQTFKGPVEIRDIQPGDEVYTWNDGKLSANRVTYRSEPRTQQVYRLRTVHREIIASGNHPFLMLRKAGRCAPPEPRYPIRGPQSYAERVPRPPAMPVPEQEPVRKRARRRDYRQVDKDEVRDLYLAGASLKELAAQFSVSVPTIWGALLQSRDSHNGQSRTRSLIAMGEARAIGCIYRRGPCSVLS